MARKTNKVEKQARRLNEFGIKLAVTGFALLVVPRFIGNPVVREALGALAGLGWLMLAGSIVLILLGRRARSASPPDTAFPDLAPSRPARRTAGAPKEAATQRPASDEPALSPASAPPPSSVRITEPDATAIPERPTTWGRNVFECIEWRRFEAVVERLFQQAGFETKSQSHGADEGVDIWLYSRHQPGAPVSIVQCKHWQGKRVGVDKVRELRGVMAARQVKRGQFATTSSFTPDAEAFARESGINLLDAQGLLELIAQRSPEQQAELLSVALEGDYWKPTCVNCGVKMIERKPRGGGAPFWGCTQYPRCRTTMPMRADARS